MVDTNTIPKIMESTSYTASDGMPNRDICREQAVFLQEHGYFKEVSILELTDKLHVLYRKLHTIEKEDVWK